MAKTYKTAQGKILDLERLRLQNELTPAIGNMRVNARGDQLGPGGQVVKSREEMLDQHYKANVGNRRNAPDVIPTSAGKVETVEPKRKAESKKKFEPAKIEVDPIPETTPEVEETEVLEDDFVDPVIETPVEPEPVVETEPEPEPEPVVETKKTTPTTKKALKGGLARAVAKTREYEESKSKPKRL